MTWRICCGFCRFYINHHICTKYSYLSFCSLFVKECPLNCEVLGLTKPRSNTCIPKLRLWNWNEMSFLLAGSWRQETWYHPRVTRGWGNGCRHSQLWENTVVQPFWQTFWQWLQKFKMHMSFDSIISCLGIYSCPFEPSQQSLTYTGVIIILPTNVRNKKQVHETYPQGCPESIL